ncbi:MAG TPA: hypothetical protein VH163_06815, partial [Gemmatimonadales bacterium]|nr:hypothetical protein [Gemmatimonadales bacterium]
MIQRTADRPISFNIPSRFPGAFLRETDSFQPREGRVRKVYLMAIGALLLAAPLSAQSWDTEFGI